MAVNLSRRDLMASCLALPAALMRARVLASKANITVGITLDTQPDWSGPENFIRSIDQVSSVGYHRIETFWNYVERWANNPQGLKNELKKRNLALETVSNGAPMQTDFADPSQRKGVMEDHIKLVRFIHWFGCDHLKINVDGKHAAGDRTAGYKEMAKTFTELGKRTKDMGMKLGVHPRLGSPMQTRQDTDAIMEMTDPNLVYLVLDTGHITMAGMDPVQLTRTYLHRIIEYHIKDVAPEHRGGFKGEVKRPYNTTAENRIFFELGKGGVDFPGIKKILDDNQWKGWWTVELDRTASTAKDSCVIAKKYLEKLGLTV